VRVVPTVPDGQGLFPDPHHRLGHFLGVRTPCRLGRVEQSVPRRTAQDPGGSRVRVGPGRVAEP
jgi:hypothetical protein